MSAEANKAVQRRWFEEGWNKHNPGLVDELFDPGFAYSGPGSSQVRSRDDLRNGIVAVLGAFPDLQIALQDQIAEGDNVVNRVAVTGTHRGEYLGVPATGKTMTWTAISIDRFANGKYVGVWGSGDSLAIRQQLGLEPARGRTQFGWGEPLGPLAGKVGTPEENKELIRRVVDTIWNRRDLDGMDALMAPDMVLHATSTMRGLESFRSSLRALQAAFTDTRATIAEAIAERDRVAIRMTWEGTLSGEWMGAAPMGKRFKIWALAIDRVVNGKVVEAWDLADFMSMYRQLGLASGGG